MENLLTRLLTFSNRFHLVYAIITLGYFTFISVASWICKDPLLLFGSGATYAVAGLMAILIVLVWKKEQPIFSIDCCWFNPLIAFLYLVQAVFIKLIYP